MAINSGILGGLIGNAPDYGKLAKRNEATRQSLINLGLQQINAVYGGGTAPFYTTANTPGAKFDPRASYYNLTGKGFQPYWIPGGQRPEGTFQPSGAASLLAGSDPITTGIFNNLTGGRGAASAVAGLATPNIFGSLGGVLGRVLGGLFGEEKSPRDIARRAFRRGQLFNAPNYQTFEGFQPEFFNQRAQAYVNYALPQLAEQYQQARNAQSFGLANRGLLGSTQQTQATQRLERETGRAKQGIAETGIEQANQLRKEIEQARQEAIRQLYQSADPAQAISSAIGSASQFRIPSAFAPITNLLGNLAQQYLVSQTLNAYRQPNIYGGAEYALANNLAPI